jgi:hypothetical protein
MTIINAQSLTQTMGLQPDDFRRLVEAGLPCWRVGESLIFELQAVVSYLDAFHREGEWPVAAESPADPGD